MCPNCARHRVAIEVSHETFDGVWCGVRCESATCGVTWKWKVCEHTALTFMFNARIVTTGGGGGGRGGEQVSTNELPGRGLGQELPCAIISTPCY